MSPMSLKSLKPVWPSGRVGILKGAWCAWPVCGTVVVVDQAGGLPLVGRLACSRVASAVPSTPVVVGGLVVFRWRPAPERPDLSVNSGTSQRKFGSARPSTPGPRDEGSGSCAMAMGRGRRLLRRLLPPCVCVLIPIVLWASSSGRGANGVGTYDQALSSAVGGVVDPFSRAPAVTGGSGQGQRDVVDGKPLVAVYFTGQARSLNRTKCSICLLYTSPSPRDS